MTSFNPGAAPDQAVVPPVTSPAVVPSVTAVEIVYKDKKLTQEQVVTKLSHADEHIARLEQERAEDRRLLAEANAALVKAATAKEVLAAPAPAAAVVPPATVDVDAHVTKVLDAREAKRAEEANWTAAQQAMTAAYGDKADAKARELASSVGMSFEDVVALARTKPLAFKRLFPELSKEAAPAVPPTNQRGNVNVPAAPAAKTGSTYWTSGKSSDQTAAYIKRLNEVTGA